MKKNLLKSALLALMVLVGGSAWAADKTVVKYSFDDAMSPSLTAGSRVSFDYDKTSVITSTKFLNAWNNTNGDPGASTVSLGNTDLSGETWTLSFEWAACGGCNSKADHTTLKAGTTNLFDLTGNSNWNTTVTITYAGSDGTKTLPVPGCDKNKRFKVDVGDQLNTTAYWHHIVVTGSASGVTMTITNSSTGTAVVEDVLLSETNVNPTSLIIEPCCGGAIGIDELSLTYFVEGEVIQTPTANYTAVNGIERTIAATCDTEGATLYYSTDGENWTEGSSITVSASGNVYFKAVKGNSESDVLTFAAVAGEAITLNAPTIVRSDNTTVTISADQTNLLLSPNATIKYTYGDETGEFTGSKTLTVAADATITAYAEATGYTTSATSERAVALFPKYVKTIENTPTKINGTTTFALSTETITVSEREYAALLLDDVQWGTNVYLQNLTLSDVWGIRNGNWYINTTDNQWILIRNLKAGDIVVANVTYPAAETVNATYSEKYTFANNHAYIVTADGDVELAFRKINAKDMDYFYGIYAYSPMNEEEIAAAEALAAAKEALQTAIAIATNINPEGLADAITAAQAALNAENATIESIAQAAQTLEAAIKAYFGEVLPNLGAIVTALNDETLNTAYADAQAALAKEDVTPQELAAAMQNIITAAQAVAPAHLQNLKGYAVKYGAEDAASLITLIDNALAAIEAGNVSQIITTMTAVKTAATPLATNILTQMIGYAQSYAGFEEDVTAAQAALRGGNYITMITTAKALYAKLIAAANAYVASVKEIPTEGKEGVDDLNAAILAAEQALEAQDADFSKINTAISNLVAAVAAFKAANQPLFDPATVIVNAEFNPEADPLGWDKVTSAQFYDLGMGLIGTYQVRGEHPAATVDETHLATEFAAGLECRWETNYAAFTQTTAELPAGAYKLTFDVENTNATTTKANYENRFNVTVGETTYADESTEWMMDGKSAWTTHTIAFTLTEASPITISLGYGTSSNNFGVGNTPALYVSHLALSTFDPLADAKATLQAEIATAEALIENATYADGKDELNAAIAAANTALTEATTAEALAEAVETLKSAEAAFNKAQAIAANAALVAGATVDNPVAAPFVVNGTFTDNVNGWTCTGGFQNRNRASNQSGDFTVPFFENWNPSAKENKMYQVIENLPNGVYMLKIAAFVNTLANPNESQFVFANNDKVFLTTGEPTFYEVYTKVEGNTLEIGLEQTTATANWMGIDNVSLTYFGADATIEAAKNSAFLKEVADVLAAKQSVKTKAALQAAYDAFVADASSENRAALEAALAAAKASVNSYKVLEAGVLPDNSLEGWTCTNTQTFHINTWSTEGNSDGTAMVTPFIENWCEHSGVLGTGEIYYTLPGLDPGIYSFSALIRAYSEAGNAPTGASLFAGDREKEFATGKSVTYNNGALIGIYDNYAMTCEVGEEGVFRFGIKIAEERNFNWMAFKNCKVAYVGAAIDEAAVNELAATMPEGKMNAEIRTAAEAALAAAKANINLDNYEAATKAVADAQASAAAYTAAAAKLANMKQVTTETNVYTSEALENYYGQWAVKYEDETLTSEEANGLQDPFLVTGWHAAVTVDNFLLSAWDTNPDFVEAPYYINTWSTEGGNDGSNFVVPFFEYWTGDGESLGEKTLTATMDDLDVGNIYDVTALVRVRMKNGAEAPAYGITFQANDSVAVNACNGDQVGTSQFYMKEVKTISGKVGADGTLKIQFKVAADNNISWLSFKNVKFVYNPAATGINDLKQTNVLEGTIYNLNGQKVNKAQKGLFIINGKKVVVK